MTNKQIIDNLRHGVINQELLDEAATALEDFDLNIMDQEKNKIKNSLTAYIMSLNTNTHHIYDTVTTPGRQYDVVFVERSTVLKLIEILVDNPDMTINLVPE